MKFTLFFILVSEEVNSPNVGTNDDNLVWNSGENPSSGNEQSECLTTSETNLKHLSESSPVNSCSKELFFKPKKGLRHRFQVLFSKLLQSR